MLIKGQFGIIQNLQMSPIPQTSFLVWTFFDVSYSKPALVINLLQVEQLHFPTRILLLSSKFEKEVTDGIFKVKQTAFVN